MAVQPIPNSLFKDNLEQFCETVKKIAFELPNGRPGYTRADVLNIGMWCMRALNMRVGGQQMPEAHKEFLTATFMLFNDLLEMSFSKDGTPIERGGITAEHCREYLDALDKQVEQFYKQVEQLDKQMEQLDK